MEKLPSPLTCIAALIAVLALTGCNTMSQRDSQAFAQGLSYLAAGAAYGAQQQRYYYQPMRMPLTCTRIGRYTNCF